MDVVGSEIGQKMRSAIKAKLTELGCYVDDELPDYVMVMVANKRTRAQMEEDLQLFLGDNTVLFVNWLHQVLRKLQEVTVTAAPPIKKTVEVRDTSKDRSSSKDHKSKEKKDKSKEKQKKGESSKKSKKKLKEKLRKKGEKKSHKKKKSKEKDTEIKRPNIPPLLMNMEKDAEPSITDVFAGQILKNHGITLETLKEDTKLPDVKPSVTELKRPIVPIIDPATISTEPEIADDPAAAESASSSQNNELVLTEAEPTGAESEQIKEINEIESKIQGLKQKLAEQLDSMSDDEDFLNIRTEAEELMNDFAEETLQETPSTIPPSNPVGTESPSPQVAPESPPRKPTEIPKAVTPPPAPPVPKEPEVLPQIELNLPKRPVRDRLGIRSDTKKTAETKKPAESKKSKERRASPERFTPDREPDFWGKAGKSAKSRLGDPAESKRSAGSDDEPKAEPSSSRRLTSRVSLLDSRETRAGPASVVRVRPRPRPATGAPASNLLMRAVADANKSLRNIPPKVDTEPQKVKRALVLPMRRGVDPAKIVIQVQADRVPSSGASDCEIDIDTESLADLESDNDIRITKEIRPSSSHGGEYVPTPLIKKFLNTDYVPLRRNEAGADVDETLVVKTINNHKTPTEKEKGPTFVVTLDGLDPNVFLAKKLKTEGLLDDEDEIKHPKPVEKIDKNTAPTAQKDTETTHKKDPAKIASPTVEKKRLSDTSEDSDTQVIIQATESNANVVAEKRKSIEVPVEDSPPPAKKRRASPIVFDVNKLEREKEKDKVRERTESTGSDNHIIVTTNSSTHKYDTLPSLSQAERKALPCRAFPMCRFGPTCAFAHPPCKFATGCTRRGCVYSHPPAAAAAKAVAPSIASQVVPVGNFKSILASSVPNMCKFYPDCANPGCHYYHPKPCRYGKACANRLHCNFYHHDQTNKWRVS